jgi:hypothetical protein
VYKETTVSDLKTDIEHGAQTESVELIDCGPASEKTKGIPLFLLFELGWPPYDRLFLFY